ncbi:putative phospholipid-binding lipoprotein MlaA precursor [Marinobacterium sp. xm-g-59]|jgi:phospholipid-binding lipoprotein MlaA|uniref:MlaA family lipoprotein n=1 Tax=Marinobacterium sp. xm-g-59 TaxID=2497748 RepID=UPI00156804B0|nr:VacJ family lipoprotein [Marinobacterium sp. xm-g-59]NRP95302.1 putative phospholipid-binding lipoprotein MlaA precursor [Marinobacterium sp. xm-g-59]
MMTLKQFRNLSLATLALLLGACSATPELEADAIEPVLPMPENLAENGISKNNDPWEGFNRRSYYFNAKADQYVILPVVSGYQWITPELVQDGVTNFFSNLGEITTFMNSVLQFKGERAMTTAFRFATNTTIGLLGVWDPATKMGVYKEKEDFGQTLGYWGVNSGPYLVIPLLGPSSARDGFGTLVDTLVYNALISELDMKTEEELALSLLRAIDARKNVPFRYYGSGSAFEYEMIRFLYFRAREIAVQR